MFNICIRDGLFELKQENKPFQSLEFSRVQQFSLQSPFSYPRGLQEHFLPPYSSSYVSLSPFHPLVMIPTFPICCPPSVLLSFFLLEPSSSLECQMFLPPRPLSPPVFITTQPETNLRVFLHGGTETDEGEGIPWSDPVFPILPFVSTIQFIQPWYRNVDQL